MQNCPWYFEVKAIYGPSFRNNVNSVIQPAAAVAEQKPEEALEDDEALDHLDDEDSDEDCELRLQRKTTTVTPSSTLIVHFVCSTSRLVPNRKIINPECRSIIHTVLSSLIGLGINSTTR